MGSDTGVRFQIDPSKKKFRSQSNLKVQYILNTHSASSSLGQTSTEPIVYREKYLRWNMASSTLSTESPSFNPRSIMGSQSPGPSRSGSSSPLTHVSAVEGNSNAIPKHTFQYKGYVQALFAIMSLPINGFLTNERVIIQNSQ